jgi:hypothetical protein
MVGYLRFPRIRGMTAKDTLFSRIAICYIHQTLQLYHTFEFDKAVERVMMTRKISVFRHFLIH